MNKKEREIILNRKLKYYTKKGIEILSIFTIGASFMTVIVCIKYKPTYKVTISGEKVGYIENKKDFEDEIKEKLINSNEKQENIDTLVYNEPQYELSLVSRDENSNGEEIAEKVKEEAEITYKYYEIALSNVPIDSVNTLQDAEELVKEIKEEEKTQTQNLDLSIIEKYTETPEEIVTNEMQVAKEHVTSKVAEKIVADQKAKEEQERINAMPVVNGIRLASLPVKGTISSRFGESSSLRKSTHTGLDIACPTGTPIKVTSDGIETWYAHTSKMYVKPGQKVKAGDVIAAVGSTGNSTGSHLHLEIRINGVAVNPQKYLYK